MSKCGRCGENVYHCLCDGGAGNKNTPPLVRKALIAELERDEAIENAEHWKKQAMLKEDALTIQRKRDRFEAAKEFVAALIPVVSTCKEEGTQIRFDCPDALFSIAWDMADRFLLAELDKEAPVKPEPAQEPQPTHRFKVGDKVTARKSIGVSGGKITKTGILEVSNDLTWHWKVDGIYFMSADLELIEAAPQPHVWSVGQYAKCPDGKVRRVVSFYGTTDKAQLLKFHDDFSFFEGDCTPCAEPEMPELPSFCTVEEDGRITDRVACFTRSLEQWIAFYDGYDYQSRFIALRDWRALTGRMV